MAGQHEILSCPFCDKGQIPCLYFPSATKVRRLSGSFGKGNAFSKSADTWVVQSGCSNCSKSQEEVEKELRRKGII